MINRSSPHSEQLGARFTKRHRLIQTVLLGVVLGLILWLPRDLALDAYVTVDERHWLVRSGNFAQALATGSYGNTFQQGHPGVTVMWLGTLGFWDTFPDYAGAAPGQFNYSADDFDNFVTAQGHRPLDLLVAGRQFVVWLNVLLLLLAWRLTGSLLRLVWSPTAAGDSARVATLSLILVGLHPFLVGHSRLLHPDSLLWSFMLISVLAYLNFWFGPSRLDGNKLGSGRWGYLTLSGVAAGLAWLTKTPGLYLIPSVGLLWILSLFRLVKDSRTDRTIYRTWLGSLVGPAVWAAIGIATFCIWWPAMWSAPTETLTKMFSISQGYAAEGHDSAIFFAGEIVNGDPGFWFYPTTYLWRSTPLDLIGLAIAAIGSILLWLRHHQAKLGRFCFVLLIFSVGYLLFMNLGAKKFDRYLLPAYAPLTIAATIGWGLLTFWLYRQKRIFARTMGGLLAAGLPIAQLILFASTFPVYLSFYNPLMGGSATAPETMMIGWGEGLAEAAAYINQEAPNGEPQVATWYGRGSLSYFLDGTFLSSHYYWQADYSVVYANQHQRQAPARQLMAHWNRTPPDHTVTLNGVDYAQVYQQGQGSLPRFVADWNEQIRLISYTLNTGQLAPDQPLQLELYLLNLAPIDQNLNMLVRIVNSAGNELLRSDRWPFGSATSDWQVDDLWVDRFALTIPPDAALGLYRVEIRFYDPSSLEALPVTEAASGRFLGETYILDYVEIGDKQGQSLVNDCPVKPNEPAVVLDNLVSLRSEIADSITVEAGETWTFALCWQTLKQPEQNYTVFAHLVDANGQLVAQEDRLPLNGFLPMWLWYPGLAVPDHYEFGLPEDLPAGVYSLLVGMYDAESGDRLPIRVGEQAIGDAYSIGQVEIR